jgi:hypothetical protein
MNYDIKIVNNYEGKGRIELDRVEFLAKHIKNIAQKSLLLQLYGYSKVSVPKKLNKYLNIFLTQTTGTDDNTILTLDADNFKNIEVQLDLFKEKQSLNTLTPMALVIKTFNAALHEEADKNLLDEPLLDELLKFKKFFYTDTEKILLSNRSTIPEIEFSRKEIDIIESLFKTIPQPEKTVVAGIIDEMKFSKEQVVLTTSDNKKIVVIVPKKLFDELKDFFGREIAITGIAHFKPGGQLSFVKMENFGNMGKAAKLLSRKPDKMTMQQQIALQLREGKKRNPIDEIFGKWPGNESDEEFEKMLKDLD